MSSIERDEKQLSPESHDSLVLLARLIAKKHQSRQQDAEGNILSSNNSKHDKEDEGTTDNTDRG